MSTNIEWTDATWNPVAGCKMVSPGCTNCYAQTMAKRLRAMAEARGDTASPYLRVIDKRGKWTGAFETVPDRLAEPLDWKKPRRVFVNSMSDLFGEGVPFEYVAAVFGVMAATPRHTYQVLTKRPARMLEFFAWIDEKAPKASLDGHRKDLCTIKAMGVVVRDADLRRLSWGGEEVWPLPNVWLGVSVENQAAADERIPLLLQAPAAVRFLSCEPLLESIQLGLLGTLPKTIAPQYTATYERLDWVIAGGESGPGARECVDEWLRSIGVQCAESGVPFFLKQLGSRAMFRACVCSGGRCKAPFCVGKRQLYRLKDPKGGDPAEWPEDLRVRQWPREVQHAG